jgi:hypothetical protein
VRDEWNAESVLWSEADNNDKQRREEEEEEEERVSEREAKEKTEWSKGMHT